MSTSIFRKRFVPMEIVDISKDEIIYRDEELLVTRWKAIKARNDIKGGISYAFLKQGYKISRFYDNDNQFAYWYCDIIESDFNMEEDKYILSDLLVDIKITPDGNVQILDVEELGDAFEAGIVEKRQVVASLKNLDKLLQMIYSGSFPPEVCSKYSY